MFNFARVFVSAEAFFSFHFFIPGWRRGQIFEVKLKCMVIRRTEQTARARVGSFSFDQQKMATWGKFFPSGKKFLFSFPYFFGRLSLESQQRVKLDICNY
jgi:hypothetical protein